VIALHGTVASTRWMLFENLPRGATGPGPDRRFAWCGPLGLAPGARSISGVTSPHRQGSAAWTAWRDVQGLDHPCAAMSTEQRARRGAHRV